MWKLWTAMFLLTLLTMKPVYGAWQRVPEGWTAPTEGYFGLERDAKDLLESAQTYRLEGTRWQTAYSDLRTEFITTTEEMKAGMNELAEQINNERAAWKAEVKRGKMSQLIYIALAGVGGYFMGR